MSYEVGEGMEKTTILDSIGSGNERLVCIQLFLADSAFLGYWLALMDRLGKQLLPVHCCLNL